ncbi:MAG: PqqD family peptide modification chaperone [Acidimicrobiia bacterium]
MLPANRLEEACRGGAWHESPRLQCLDFDCSVRANDPTLVDYITWLYEACSRTGPPSHRFIVRRRTASREAVTTVYRDGIPLVRDVPPGLAVARLVWEINQATVAASGHRLLLHAAAAERDGAVALLPGPPGAGKSTFVAGLVQAGLRYVTDETVAVDPSTRTIESYPKPIALDRGAPVLATLHIPVPEALESGSPQLLAPPQAFRADAVAPPGGVARVILFAKYRPGRATAPVPLSRAEAAVALAEHSFNFRALGPGALELVADVVRAGRCYRLGVSDLGAACRHVAELLDEPGDGRGGFTVVRNPDLETTLRMSDAEFPAGEGVPQREPDVEWVELDGEVVAYDPVTQTLHRLNGSAAQVWAACDGSTSVADIVRAMQSTFDGGSDVIDRDVRRLLQHLRQLGLLRVPPVDHYAAGT